MRDSSSRGIDPSAAGSWRLSGLEGANGRIDGIQLSCRRVEFQGRERQSGTVADESGSYGTRRGSSTAEDSQSRSFGDCVHGK